MVPGSGKVVPGSGKKNVHTGFFSNLFHGSFAYCISQHLVARAYERGGSRYLACCVVFCRLLFVLSLLVIVLSVLLRFAILITPLVSSSSS